MHNNAVRRVLKRIEAIKQHPPCPRQPPNANPEVWGDEAGRLREKLKAHRVRNGYRELPTIPGVQSLSVNIRYIDGGRDRFVELVQNAALHNHDGATKWLYVYGTLTIQERARVNFDDICAASGVTPSALMATIVETEMNFNRDVSDVIRAIAKPKVVKTLIDSAIDRKGAHPEISERDRMRFLQADGTLPVPKGTVIQVAANAQAAAVAGLDESVPSFSQAMSNIKRVQRLPAAPEE